MLENVLTYLSISISFFQLTNSLLLTLFTMYTMSFGTDIIWCLSHLWHLKISFYDTTDFEIWIICNQTNKNVCKRALKWLWLLTLSDSCDKCNVYKYYFLTLSILRSIFAIKKMNIQPLRKHAFLLMSSNGH